MTFRFELRARGARGHLASSYRSSGSSHGPRSVCLKVEVRRAAVRHCRLLWHHCVIHPLSLIGPIFVRRSDRSPTGQN